MSDPIQYAVLPSDPAARKKVMDMVVEISNSFTRIEAERSLIKETIAAVADEHDIKKPILAKLAKLYHKQSAADEKAGADEVFEAYTLLTGEVLE